MRKQIKSKYLLQSFFWLLPPFDLVLDRRLPYRRWDGTNKNWGDCFGAALNSVEPWLCPWLGWSSTRSNVIVGIACSCTTSGDEMLAKHSLLLRKNDFKSPQSFFLAFSAIFSNFLVFASSVFLQTKNVQFLYLLKNKNQYLQSFVKL